MIPMTVEEAKALKPGDLFRGYETFYHEGSGENLLQQIVYVVVTDKDNSSKDGWSRFIPARYASEIPDENYDVAATHLFLPDEMEAF